MLLLKKICLPAGLAFLCFACSVNNAANTKNTSGKNSSSGNRQQVLVFDKLLGTWKNDNGKSYERWTKNANGSYHSVGFRIKGKDTVYTEDVSVYMENGKWISENKVIGQNNGNAVKFTASLLKENQVQFSNPAHDFPTDINYTVVNSNTVHAFIVGPNNKGGKDTIPFNFKRIAE